jgi:hypothetical protein
MIKPHLCHVLILFIEDDADITRVEWVKVNVRARMAFIPEEQLEHTRTYGHDILILHTSSGRAFVFDPSGYQFGFGDYLHRWSVYARDFVVAGSVTICNPGFEMMMMSGRV